MDSKTESLGARACWFVGATYRGVDDQTTRFLTEGIWEYRNQDKHLNLVKSIQVGDRIAIKASYTRRLGLPFDNRGFVVSVMAIKAIGTVRENLGDLASLAWILDRRRPDRICIRGKAAGFRSVS